MTEPDVLLTGLAFGESARWHDDRLWFANWGTGEVRAMDPDGRSEVVVRLDPGTVPISIDWLPDGRMLVVDGPRARLLRREPDGELVLHADLGGVGEGFNEIVVDARGTACVNGGPAESRAAGCAGPWSSTAAASAARSAAPTGAPCSCWPRGSTASTRWRPTSPRAAGGCSPSAWTCPAPGGPDRSGRPGHRRPDPATR
jgi:hypothetical protein